MSERSARLKKYYDEAWATACERVPESAAADAAELHVLRTDVFVDIAAAEMFRVEYGIAEGDTLRQHLGKIIQESARIVALENSIDELKRQIEANR